MRKFFTYFMLFIKQIFRLKLPHKQQINWQIIGYGHAVDGVPEEEGIAMCRETFAIEVKNQNGHSGAHTTITNEKLQQLEEKLDETDKAREVRHKEYLEEEKQEKRADIDNQLAEHAAELDIDEKTLNHSLKKLYEAIKKLGYEPSAKNLLDYVIAVIIIFLSMWGFEILASVPAFRFAGQDETLVYGLALGLPLGLALSAELAGFMLAKGKIWLAATFILIGLACTTVIYHYRMQGSVVEMPKEQVKPEPRLDEKFVVASGVRNTISLDDNPLNDINAKPLTVVNIILFMLMLIVSYVFHSRRVFWVHKKRSDKSTISIKGHNAFIAGYDKYLKDLDTEFENKAKANADEEKRDLESEKEKLKNSLTLDDVTSTHNNVYQKGLADLAVSHYKKGYREGVRARENRHGGTTLSTVIGLMLLLVTQSCNHSDQNRVTGISTEPAEQVVFIDDKTKSMTVPTMQDVDGLMSFVKMKMGFSGDEVSYRSFIVKLTTIDGVSLTPVKTLTLKAVPFRKRNWQKRKIEIETFLEELRTAVIEWYTAPARAQDTYLNEILGYHLNQVASSGKKTCLVLRSDCIHDSPYYDFELFKNDISGFRSSFQEIADTLYRQRPLPDLKGMEIVIMHQTYDTRWDALAAVSKEFWIIYLGTYGAIVHPIPNF